MSILTVIIAHRGYSAAYPENTMKAFIEAEKAGAEGLEIDVQLTKDGEVVVIHDEKIDRTTNGSGFVKDLTYKELRRYNAGNKHLTIIKKEPVPSLQEVLEWLKTTELVCNIELKNGLIPYKGMEEKVVEMVRKLGVEDKIIISSFNHYSVVYSHRLAPEIETAPILAEGLYMPWVYAQSIRAKGIHPHFRAATNEIIKSSQEEGINVRPYTVNKESELERLFKVGTSAVITDDPKKALRIRSNMKSTKDR